MNLVEVDNGWKKDVLFIDLSIGNVCNYRCNYCFPGANDGNFKFPDYDTLIANISHLLTVYKTYGKKQFDIHFVGGEPSHWPQLFNFVKFLKDNFNCLISMTSNGSKKIEYWEQVAQYFNRIHMSCHHEYVEIEKFRDVCDLLYEKNVIVSVSTMMDPHAWDKCMGLVDYLKNSKHRWTIRYSELNGEGIEYTPEQLNVLAKHRARGPNIFWFFKNNKHFLSKVKVTDNNNNKHKFNDNEIMHRGLNTFYGWECSVGSNFIAITHNGDISGTCGQLLYGNKKNYNIRDVDFITKFNPVIQSSICKQLTCNCMLETNMPKRKCIK